MACLFIWEGMPKRLNKSLSPEARTSARGTKSHWDGLGASGRGQRAVGLKTETDDPGKTRLEAETMAETIPVDRGFLRSLEPQGTWAAWLMFAKKEGEREKGGIRKFPVNEMPPSSRFFAGYYALHVKVGLTAVFPRRIRLSFIIFPLWKKVGDGERAACTSK